MKIGNCKSNIDKTKIENLWILIIIDDYFKSPKSKIQNHVHISKSIYAFNIPCTLNNIQVFLCTRLPKLPIERKNWKPNDLKPDNVL